MDNFSKGQEAGYLQEWAASARDAVNRLEDFADLMDRIRDEHSEYDYSDFQARCAGMFGDGLESFLDGNPLDIDKLAEMLETGELPEPTTHTVQHQMAAIFGLAESNF